MSFEIVDFCFEFEGEETVGKERRRGWLDEVESQYRMKKGVLIMQKIKKINKNFFLYKNLLLNRL